MKKLSQSNRRLEMMQVNGAMTAQMNQQMQGNNMKGGGGSMGDMQQFQTQDSAQSSHQPQHPSTGGYIQSADQINGGSFPQNQQHQANTHRELQHFQQQQMMKQQNVMANQQKLGKSQKLTLNASGTPSGKGMMPGSSGQGGVLNSTRVNPQNQQQLYPVSGQQNNQQYGQNNGSNNEVINSSLSPRRNNRIVPMNEMSMANMRQQQDKNSGNATLDAQAMRNNGLPLNQPQVANYQNSLEYQGRSYNGQPNPKGNQAVVSKRSSQVTMTNNAGLAEFQSNNYANGSQEGAMRNSREQWNTANQKLSQHESNRTIDHNTLGGVGINQQLSSGHNQRKLQNIRKGRYNNTNTNKTLAGGPGAANTTNGSSSIINDVQKSYRGPVIKNGLHISQQLTINSASNGGIMGSLPNSTKNQLSNVQNKFGSRDLSPKNIMTNPGQGSVVSNVPTGHTAQIGFQQKMPGHSGRVQSLDVNNPMNPMPIVPKQRGGIQQTPSINLSSSAAPPQIPQQYQPNTTKAANAPQNPTLSQSNFNNHFGMNTIGSPLQSPYSQGLAQKQINLQNQQIQNGQSSNNKGSQKEMQLIQAYQQHTQRLKEQAQTYKKSRAQPRSIDPNDRVVQNTLVTPHNQNQSPWAASPSQQIQNRQQQQTNYNLNDHLNTMRPTNGAQGGPNAQGSLYTSSTNANSSSMPAAKTAAPAQGMPLNSTRVVPSNKSKLIDSKMSSLRREQDSTAASNNNHRFPMTPDEAFKVFSPYMWDIEKKEIFNKIFDAKKKEEVYEFPQIYFFPLEERKKQKNLGMNSKDPGSQSDMGILNEQTNNGFDSDTNEYLSRINEHIQYRYEITKKVGKGSFGVVLKCYDHKNREYMALKILKNKKRLYKQGLVEAKLIKHLNDKDLDDKKNIIRRIDQFNFRKHLMILFEMLSVNLYEFIKMNHFQGFSLNLIKRFAIQILISLYYLSENNIVHCDLKPENILLRKINKSGIKIIDFGSGCFENEKIYTYIQSRFYRAPEIVLGIPYNAAIDMWSFGCILYELYVGYPLFPGEDEKDHMALMMEIKGIPPRSVLARSSRRKVFFDDDYNPIITPNSRGKIRMPGNKNLFTMMNCQDRDFVDFIDKCIEWKPEQRLSPEQAFSHPFISKAVNELKCLKDQPQTEEGGRQGGNASSTPSQQQSNKGQSQGGQSSDQQSSSRNYQINQGQAKTKSGSKLPTIRKN